MSPALTQNMWIETVAILGRRVTDIVKLVCGADTTQDALAICKPHIVLQKQSKLADSVGRFVRTFEVA